MSAFIPIDWNAIDSFRWTKHVALTVDDMPKLIYRLIRSRSISLPMVNQRVSTTGICRWESRCRRPVRQLRQRRRRWHRRRHRRRRRRRDCHCQTRNHTDIITTITASRTSCTLSNLFTVVHRRLSRRPRRPRRTQQTIRRRRLLRHHQSPSSTRNINSKSISTAMESQINSTSSSQRLITTPIPSNIFPRLLYLNVSPRSSSSSSYFFKLW